MSASEILNFNNIFALRQYAVPIACVKSWMEAATVGQTQGSPIADAPLLTTKGNKAMSKRDAYIEKMKLELDAMNAKMNVLEARAKDAKDDARDKYREEMNKLRHQSKLAVAKLNELKAAGEESWDRMVTEMEKIRDAFTHSFHYFKSQI